MSTIAVSTVFDRGRTQVPAKVRKKLGIKDGDTIVWKEDPSITGGIVVHPGEEQGKGRFGYLGEGGDKR